MEKIILKDNIDVLYKINNNLNDKEQMYILSGKKNNEYITIEDYFEVEDHIIVASYEHLEIEKKYLYACLKTISSLNRVCIILHTHPLQNKDDLIESEYDCKFFKNIVFNWNKMSSHLPIIFGIMCDEHVMFKIYEENKFKNVEWESKYNVSNENCWQLEIIYGKEYKYGIVCSNKSKGMKRVKTEDALKIAEWEKKYRRKELTQLQEMSYRKFIEDNFDVFKDTILTSEYSYNKSRVINELVFMTQLGCNLNCKYCYAHGGTYDYGENMILKPESGKKIVDALLRKHIHIINKVTFIGGEPSMFPETIGEICHYMNMLADSGKLDKKPRYFMVTNGVNFTEAMYNNVKNYDMKLTISLDGSPKVNDQLRIQKNGKGTFYEVLATIKKLRQQGTEPVMIETTYTCIHEYENITRNQIVDQLRRITDIKNILVVDCEGEYEPICKKRGLDEEKDIEKLYDVCKMCGVACKSGLCNDVYCGAGYQNMAVLDNGEYYPCHRFVSDKSIKLGNLFDNEELKTFSLVNKRNNKKCLKCWAINFCKDCNWNIYRGSGIDCKRRLQEIRESLLEVFNVDEKRYSELEEILK